jgi:CBS domain-containing protein
MDSLTTPVRDLMATPVVAMGIEGDLEKADALLRLHRISAILVVGRDGSPAGVISRRDLLRAGAGGRVALELPAMAAADLMSKPVISVTAATPIAAACRELALRRIHRVFVLDGGRPAGVFSTREALATVAAERIAQPIGDFIGPDVIAVETSTPLGETLAILARAGIGGVVVLDGTMPVGLFTEREALEAAGRPASTPTEDVMTQALLCLPMRTPLFRAAGFALATTARRIVVTDHHHAKGVMTGLDFAAFLARPRT